MACMTYICPQCAEYWFDRDRACPKGCKRADGTPQRPIVEWDEEGMDQICEPMDDDKE